MKNHLLLLFMALSLVSSAAIDTIKTNTKISEVTVFFNGAQISRTANISVSKGKHFILLDRLPEEINPQSIQVSQIKNCQILSVKHDLDFTGLSKKSQKERDIEERIKDEELKFKEVSNRYVVYQLEEKLILNNSDFKQKDAGATLEEVKAAAQYYQVRLNEIKAEKLKLKIEVDEINERIKELYAEFNKITVEKRQNYSKVVIAIEGKMDTKSELNVTYYVPSAGWEPTYDFRVDDVDKPLNIVYNANVYQSTGEDWKNVDITLSTNNPSLSGSKPKIERWYLNRTSPYANKGPQEEGVGSLKGRVIDGVTGEPLPFANVAVYRNGKLETGTTTDFEGLYTIKPLKPGYINVKVGYVGYNNYDFAVTIAEDEESYQNVNMNSSDLALQEVVIMEEDDVNTLDRMELNRLPTRDVAAAESRKYKKRKNRKKNAYYDGTSIRGSRASSTTTYIDNSIATRVANLEFKIKIPYNVPSDGEDYSIKIKEVSTEVDYVFYAVPKLEEEAFLTANMTNWVDLDLLSGFANIFYQGTYVAETYLDVYMSKDTLPISLGRDRNVIVERVGNKNKNDKTFIGNSVKETVAWDITVRNNRKTPINLIIQDQYPLSELKSVEVGLIEAPGAKNEAKTGFLTWELNLNSGEKKELGFSYSLKYEKGVILSLEN